MELDWESVLCREGISHPTKKVGVLNLSEQLWRWGFSISCLAIGESLYCAILSRNLRMWLKECWMAKSLGKDCHLTMVSAFILEDSFMRMPFLKIFSLFLKKKRGGTNSYGLRMLCENFMLDRWFANLALSTNWKGCRRQGVPLSYYFLIVYPIFCSLSRKPVGETFAYGCAVANFLFS